MNHIGEMFLAFYNVLKMPWTIDGITFTLFDVLEAGILFYCVAYAIDEFWGLHHFRDN